jgi:hypothetical protein
MFQRFAAVVIENFGIVVPSSQRAAKSRPGAFDPFVTGHQ